MDEKTKPEPKPEKNNESVNLDAILADLEKRVAALEGQAPTIKAE